MQALTEMVSQLDGCPQCAIMRAVTGQSADAVGSRLWGRLKVSNPPERCSVLVVRLSWSRGTHYVTATAVTMNVCFAGLRSDTTR